MLNLSLPDSNFSITSLQSDNPVNISFFKYEQSDCRYLSKLSVGKTPFLWNNHNSTISPAALEKSQDLYSCPLYLHLGAISVKLVLLLINKVSWTFSE